MLVAICALAISAVGLFFIVSQLPDVEDSLRDEISLLATQNGHDHIDLKEQATQIREGLSFGRYPHLRKESEKVQQILDSLLFEFDRAIATGSTEKLRQLLNEAQQSFDTSLFQEMTPPSFLNANARLTDVNKMNGRQLRELALEHVRFDVHAVMAEYLLKLRYMTPANSVAVDKGFPQRPESWKKGKISVRVPAIMKLGETHRIEIRISKELEAELFQQLGPLERVVFDSLWVGDIMVIRLQGEKFSIVEYDEEEQGVLNGGYTQWEYDIKPLETGRHKLLVKAGIVYHVPNLGPTRKFFPVYDVEIDIEVNPVERLATFASERWEFLVSTILIPLASFFYGRMQRRKGQKQEAESTKGDE